MLIAYSPVYESTKWNEPDDQPRLFVGNSGMGFMLTLSTSDFNVNYKDGKAEVSLARHMKPEQVKSLALALIDAAEAQIKLDRTWSSSEVLVSSDAECPSCDGSGKVGG